jgi:hypothetical protein
MSLDRYYFKGEPTPWGCTLEGRASKPCRRGPDCVNTSCARTLGACRGGLQRSLLDADQALDRTVRPGGV